MNSYPKEMGYRDEIYEAALKFFRENAFQGAGFLMENDYVKNHKEELCYCYEHNKMLIDFDWWCCYEDLLNVRISYEEYLALDRAFDGDPLEISSEDTQTINALQNVLHLLRGEIVEETWKQEPVLEKKILNAQEKLVKKEMMSKEELYQALYDKFKESNKVFETELSGMEFKEMKPYVYA